MRHYKKVSKSKKAKRIMLEDLRLLQKMISGRSVYKNTYKVYRRSPKHKKSLHAYF